MKPRYMETSFDDGWKKGGRPRSSRAGSHRMAPESHRIASRRGSRRAVAAAPGIAPPPVYTGLARPIVHVVVNYQRNPNSEGDTVSNLPSDFPRISPCLFYDDPRAALEWLEKAFGFHPRI